MISDCGRASLNLNQAVRHVLFFWGPAPAAHLHHSYAPLQSLSPKHTGSPDFAVLNAISPPTATAQWIPVTV